ncbi:HAMP domain-containing protein [Seinonella peptonophila]|uniref:histidine kinase n=1 Tax=Seinonella peptonophila TaxID=112248 RepID=A0A1M4XVW1_9BACL|nr:HAMP domain-containing sensor histidine kinase [Seinonella peptonophila]SHE97717.1 HAMP domain-containing protein [Seinonella peptonophila]
MKIKLRSFIKKGVRKLSLKRIRNFLVRNVRGLVTKSIRRWFLFAVFSSLILAGFFTSLIERFILLKFPLTGLLSIFSNLYPVGLFFLFFHLLTRRQIHYIKMLASGIMKIAHGDFQYRVPVNRVDELGLLAENINQMADQLQQQKIREREWEQSKMELITGVSHDLRTPLTSIIGYLNLLQLDTAPDPVEQKRYLRNALRKTTQLKKLIDDLFVYTRLADKDVQLQLQEVNFVHLLEQLVYEFEPIAENRIVRLKIDKAAANLFIRLDSEKMVRAIDNLLLNALKFSEEDSEITIQLLLNQQQIRLSIHNVGQPITVEQEKKLFDRFYKSNEARNDQNVPSGSGLGLPIAKSIIELHKGEIGLEHKQGAFTFYIILPRTHSLDTVDSPPFRFERGDNETAYLSKEQ